MERRNTERRVADRECPQWVEPLAIGLAALKDRQDIHERVCNQRHEDNAELHKNAHAELKELRSVIWKAAFGIVGALGGVCMLLIKVLLVL